jgi:hypothetical protein
MIGTLRFSEGEGYGPEFHYIGLNLSQSGAAIIIAPEEDTLPSARTGYRSAWFAHGESDATWK